MQLHPHYQVDEQGNRVAVVLDMAEFEMLLTELEDLREREALRAEFEAWDAVTDEALVLFERTLD